LAREALEVHVAELGPRHERTALNLRVLGDIEHALSRPDSAIAHYLRALDIVRETRGAAHQEVAALRLREARIHDERGDDGVAEAAYGDAVRTFTEALGAGHYLTVDASLYLLEFLAGRGRGVPAAALAAALAPAVDSLGARFPVLHERLNAARQRIDGGG